MSGCFESDIVRYQMEYYTTYKKALLDHDYALRNRITRVEAEYFVLKMMGEPISEQLRKAERNL